MLFIFRCEDSDYFAITQIRWAFLGHFVGRFWGISLGVFEVFRWAFLGHFVGCF